MGSPQATLYYGFSIENEWDHELGRTVLEKHGWQEHFAAKAGIPLIENEYSENHAKLQKLMEDFDIAQINDGDDGDAIATIGIRSTVVNTDWEQAQPIAYDHPIRGEVSDSTEQQAEYTEKLQRFCAIMGLKVNVEQLTEQGKCGWYIAAYYPAG